MLMQSNDLTDLTADSHRRVEAALGILEHNANAATEETT